MLRARSTELIEYLLRTHMHSMFPMNNESCSRINFIGNKVCLSLTCDFKGIAIGLKPLDMYCKSECQLRYHGGSLVISLTCQSKQIERRPSPSLPLLPPNTLETAALFGAARQKTDTPVRRGNIHSGNSSQIKMLEAPS